MIKIGYMTGEYPRVTDTFIQQEVAALRQSGWQVDTFSVRRPHAQEQLAAQAEETARTTYILPTSLTHVLTSHAKLLLASPSSYLGALKLAGALRQPGIRGHLWQLFYFIEAGVLAQMVRQRALQHLHNHFGDGSASVAMLAAKLGGFTYSLTIHGSAIWFEPARWCLDKKADNALFIACISHFCRSQTMLYSSPDVWNKIHVVHCGVDPSLYRPRAHMPSPGRILFVGRLAAVKGLPVLFEALETIRQRHPQVKLTLVGGGNERPQLEAAIRARSLSGHVELVGPKSPAEVREHLQQADLLVISSFAEGVPVVAMEAFASQVPVVATRVGGTAELVEDGVSGFLVPPGDASALAARINALLDDASLRQRFGEAGRAHVTRAFDSKREATWLGEIMTAAMAGKVLPTRPDH